MSLQTKVNVQKLIGAAGIILTIFAFSIQPMQPTLAFYLIAASNALNAGLQFYFGATNTELAAQNAAAAKTA